MQIRWEAAALSDLVCLRNFITEENPTAARKGAQRIIDSINLLVGQPLFGGPGRIHKTRELVITNTPYTLIYHANADTVTILGIFHQARKWPEEL
jgi:toxin ParE1/3/4